MRMRLAVIAGLALVAGAAAARVEAPPPIRIGLPLPTSGDFARIGREAQAAIDIARSMANERGGVRGRRIEFAEADVPTPEAAMREAERLAGREGVKIVLGAANAPLAIQASQAAERFRALYWEATAPDDLVTRRGMRYTFQVGPAAYRYARAAVDFALHAAPKLLNMRAGDLRIALLWESRPFGETTASVVRAYAGRLGARIVFDRSYDRYVDAMPPVVAALAASRPDIVIAASHLDDAVRFQQAASAAGFGAKAFVGVNAGYADPGLRAALRAQADGIFVVGLPPWVLAQALTPRAAAAADEFDWRYRARTRNPPSGHALASFAAAWALMTELLPAAASLGAHDLRAAALALDLAPGALANGGGVTFTNRDWPGDRTDAGQNLRAAIGLWQWQAGVPRLVYPPALATHDAVRPGVAAALGR